MLYSADLASRRQQIIKMIAPTGWIFAFAVPTRNRPAKHRFDAPTHPTRCFWLFKPDWLDGSHDMRCVDLSDRHLAKTGEA